LTPALPPRCVAVAYSGGRDSTALLHATLAAADSLGVKVAALHVHHGLSVHADAWLAHCASTCRRWARRGSPLVFASVRVADRPARGESVEAWARLARYSALRAMAIENDAVLVLLAHHRRDQAETVLIQALRGAGPAGLAAMPASAHRDGVTWARPWLDRPREDIEAYVRRHRLLCVEDDSNDDPRFLRNRLRLQVWPALSSAFPDAETALADCARRAQEAAQCLSDQATDDLGRVSLSGESLNLKAWFELSPARRSNALRAWLKSAFGGPATASLVARLMAELRPAGVGRWPTGSGELRAYRGQLAFVASPADTGQGADPALEESLSVGGVGDFVLPGWGGCLRVSPIEAGGVSLEALGRLELRPRQGAERFQAGMDRPPRSLKKQYQAANIPQWERSGPLIYSGGRLVYVPGLGIDARMLASPRQPQVCLRWSSIVGGRFDDAQPADCGR
jgi:tRNA(Ile)-lysidine synthase